MAQGSTRLECLGTAGAPARGRLTTCFRLAEGVVVDAGALTHALPHDEQMAVTDLLLSHSHIDHTLGVPFRLAYGPMRIWGLPETLAAVRESLFDGRTWPDISQNGDWREVGPDDTFTVGGFRVRTGPSDHTVPCLTYCVERDGRSVAIVGDTRRNDDLIRWVAECGAAGCIVECSFPDRSRDLAVQYGHQVPDDLRAWRRGLGPDVRLYATHVKPADEDEILGQCAALGDPALTVLRDGDAFDF